MDKSQLINQWSQEYDQGGIPSSTRTTPSGAVVWAINELKRRQFPLREAIDVGCGKGRNSLYLAEQGMHVTSMDFTPNAIRHLEDESTRRGLADKIRPLTQDVTEDWPVAEASADFIIDAFCFKHITPHALRQAYKDNVLHALRTRGHYLISFASIGDGYYGRYVTEKIDDDEFLAVDPTNEIPSLLFSRKRIMSFFEPELVLTTELQNNKSYVMHGEIQPNRSTYALLFERTSHLL